MKECTKIDPMNPSPHLPDTTQRYDMLQAGLDLLNQGITVFDANLRLVAWNRPFLKLLDFPEELARVGTPFEHFIRHNAERGEYGPGDRKARLPNAWRPPPASRRTSVNGSDPMEGFC